MCSPAAARQYWAKRDELGGRALSDSTRARAGCPQHAMSTGRKPPEITYRPGRSAPPQSPGRSRNMAAIRRRDTGPERAMRSALHASGLRFRVDYPVEVDGKRVRPDVVFTRDRLAVFVDGCFWHGCPAHAKRPKHNAEFWAAKLAANKRRDAEQNGLLVKAGWSVLRIWEHSDPVEAASRVRARLRDLAGMKPRG